ncbi:glycoside hydrolase family 76 protein [Sandaracinus amylolyticus]|uniref:glycoside hydrolase family 76 protein n=1 Tax=Sandaracinus amylolyticus TaxID=927083 RepID=UPI001F2CD205|nr:glycoside hydrolase family 76 protein [Sandaracinus amylolyticus]UJR80492.1 Serine O-acetyltransferase [Sandaracinus amylolyticus]
MRVAATVAILVSIPGCVSTPPTAREGDAGARDAAIAIDAGATIDAAIAVDAGDDAGSVVLPCTDSEERHRRADEALSRFLVEFWRGDAQYLRAQVPGDTLSAYWVYAQAFDALLDGVERTDGRRYRGLVASFALGQSRRGWSSDYYDDENWMALALIRAFDLTGDRGYLDRAQQLFGDIEAAWDTTCCGANPGGIWWDRAHTQKATASNGGPVITAVRLHARTGDAQYLAFARMAYAYWREHMVDPETGQVWDHVAPDGAITRWKFTYNEGVMIGAALALLEATGETRYLDDARTFARFMREHETVTTDLGPVLSDGDDASCRGDCQQFKGIGHRYLDALQTVDPDDAIAALLRASADSLWTRARDPETGHFGTDWTAAPSGDGASISQMSAAITALSLDASRCGAWVDSIDAAQFEAEDGAITDVGLEASSAGFTGWAYLAGWSREGSGVAMRIEAASAGRHRIALRYAGDDGEAVRTVRLNGTVIAEAQRFPATGSWGTYATVELVADLPAGPSALELRVEGARGSRGFLNLDHARLTRE